MNTIQSLVATGSKSGNACTIQTIKSNQSMMNTPNGVRVYYSYKEPVVICFGGMAMATNHKWSVTTSKHIGQMLSHAGHPRTVRVPQDAIYGAIADGLNPKQLTAAHQEAELNALISSSIKLSIHVD